MLNHQLVGSPDVLIFLVQLPALIVVVSALD